MAKSLKPEFIFETSWEVCNMVGGIYTVLSTRAATLQQLYPDKVIFIGPDVWSEVSNPYFMEDAAMMIDWKSYTYQEYGLKLKIGRWTVPGNPIAVLVDFKPLFAQKNIIYAKAWEWFQVDSISAYGDYDESSMFGYASGMLIESFYKFFDIKPSQNIIAHFNEWMTTFGIFYVKKNVPQVATIFTTHATSIGRSIAGNNKPLYDYLDAYNGDQMAKELNMVAKHSTEKLGAHHADCFTTVSDITAKEAEQLLQIKAHVVTPNGFENDFLPSKNEFDIKREAAQNKLRDVAEVLLGFNLSKSPTFIATAGRYEYKNKGIDVFIDSLKRLTNNQQLESEIVVFIMVPAHIKGPRVELQKILNRNNYCLDSWNNYTTHELYNYDHDNVMNALRWHNFNNEQRDKVKIIFVPSYLNGNDGIFNMKYYDLLIGMDLTVFPSYYEPWGYTPLESVAFSVPTITTNLSGFGQWVSDSPTDIEHGVGVIHRSDYNSEDVANEIAKMIFKYTTLTKNRQEEVRKSASLIAEKALWKNFITFYEEAYKIALENRSKRIAPKKKTK
jgi:glycosyltransferase involved in cell wall biosynthesis